MRRSWAVAAALVVLAACGDDDDGAGPTTAAPTSGATTSSTAEPTSTTGAGEATTTTAPAERPEVPVLFPVGDELVTDPGAAAQGFVDTYLPTSSVFLGEFQQGDSTSGEVPVFGAREDGSQGQLRTTLLLRQFGTGWYVTAAVNEFVTVTEPGVGDAVPSGRFTVSGKGRGFEAALSVSVVPAGGGEPLDVVPATGGSFETPEPYEVEVDVSGVSAGEVVVLLVQGGTGLDRDPGEFSAIPVLVVIVD